MYSCPSCCFPNSEQARLCGHCGLYLKPIGDYIITERIGTGGFAEVYRAVNRYTGHSAAIKLLHRKLIDDKESEQRFLREVEILKELHSPNIVQIYDFGILEDMGLYLIMEWLDGRTLDVHLHAQANKKLSFQEVIPLFSQLLYGLSHIHEKKVVHRDLKPKNFMVVQENGKQVLKILDFGIAWVPGGKDLTGQGMFVGSTYFMAPEQFKAQKEYFGPATDLYVAGQLLVWMLTGKHIFTANTLQALAIRHCVEQPPSLAQMSPGVAFAPALEAIVSKALQKKVPNRYQTAMDFLSAFRNIIPIQIKAQQEATPDSFAATQPAPMFRLASTIQAVPSAQAVPPTQVVPPPRAPSLRAPSLQAPSLQAPPSHFQAPKTPKQSWGSGLNSGEKTRPMSSHQGDLMLQEHVSLAPMNVPRLASASFPQLSAPRSQDLRQPFGSVHLQQTPLMPLKALHQQIPQRDSTPGDIQEQPIRTFSRKATSMQRVPSISKHSQWKKRLTWGLLTIGVGITLSGIVLFILPFFGLSAPPVPTYSPQKTSSFAPRTNNRPIPSIQSGISPKIREK